MSYEDSFPVNLQQAESTLKLLKSLAVNKEDLFSKGKFTGKIDSMIETNKTKLDRLIVQLTTSSKSREFNDIEIESRKKKVREIKNQEQEIFRKLEHNLLIEMSQTDDLEENKVDSEGNIVPASQNSSSKRNKMLLKEQMKLLNKQDIHLDDLGKITGQMREDNKQINEELAIQHQLIKELDEQISKTTSSFKKADLKLRRLIQSSSKLCLWLIIIFELMLMFGILFML
ncbi:unnamed protein product [Moneuplotes crassus]|uniref:t-SNARE coiled-coil homology domain-containing protein n=1 Tax=Euplotes crassus TaxID=5936 RepID=A0AAD1XVN5_EUPCR|nr:unnamed protein product [Moneuplotes crassus]